MEAENRGEATAAAAWGEPPALLTRVSIRLKRPSARATIRSAVAYSDTSPSTAATSGSSDDVMVRAFATTAQPCRR